METAIDYPEFIRRKSQANNDTGFEPIWMPDFLLDFQQYATGWSVRKGRSALFEDCGLGKGQPEGAMILTSEGFKKNTDLSVGDMIVASDGDTYPLQAIHVRGIQRVYRIHFSDGCNFVVDADHLHIVRTNNDRQRRKPWRVISTTEVIKMPIRYGTGGKSRNLDIPIVAPIRMDQKTHWIHPYVMGVILGDGCITKRCTITLADQQIIDTVRSLLPAGWTLIKLKHHKYDYRLSKGGTTNRELIRELRRLGILGTRSSTKFIPPEYLMDSIDNRVWLLRGLMDTDGWIKDTSQFYSTSDQLADDATYLIRSLGGAPTRTKKKTSCIYKGKRSVGADCNILTFSLKTFNPFHLSRKSVLWNSNPRDNGRWIDRIEECGFERTICLSVGSPDRSYVTENFIVTHNTIQEMVWAENVVRKTNGRVLIMTPLAVSHQFVGEGEKFGIEIHRSSDGTPKPNITVTNYERLDKFNPDDYAGVVADESQILKHWSGATQKSVTRFMSKIPYRLLGTATPSPNDYTEMGTCSEALGEMTYTDMLSAFFRQVSDDEKKKRAVATDIINSKRLSWRVLQSMGQWAMKSHAFEPFWKWVSSWARACRKPSDLGPFDDSRFVLPELRRFDHIVKPRTAPDGFLFTIPAFGFNQERAERRRTLGERTELVANLVKDSDSSVIWCHLNPEGDMLEKEIPGAVQVKGSQSMEEKEELILAFIRGEARHLVTKAKIAGLGLNLQHCAHVVTFVDHSYEKFYQCVRRCYRFGQKRSVRLDVIATEGEVNVRRNMDRKERLMNQMFEQVVRFMNDSLSHRVKKGNTEIEIPKWLTSNNDRDFIKEN